MYTVGESDRYARQTILPEIGEDGQRRLHGASALIVGLGGLGCPVVLYLAGAGVGRVGLCDADVVSESNLQRQTLYDMSMLGRPKPAMAMRRVAALNPEVVCECVTEGLTPENAAGLVACYDIVVDCCDNFATRYLIDDVCRRLDKPWVYGSIGAFQGCVSTFLPGLPGFDTLFPDRDELISRPPSSGGVLGAVPGIVGALQAAEVLKQLCGFGAALSRRLLTLDTLTMTFETIEF